MANDLDMTIADAFDALGADDGTPDEGPDDAAGTDPEPDGPDAVEGDGDDDPDGELYDELDDGDGEPADDADEGDAEGDGNADPVTVSDDDVIRLPDGTEVPVKESALRQADYTRKTQELADKRRELEQQTQQVQEQYERLTTWVQERSQDPVKFAAEIASSTGDATLGIAKVIRHLADHGQLDESFAEAFGLTVNKTIDERNPQAEVDELKQQLQQDQEQRQQQERQQQVVQHYLSEWDQIKQSEGLQYRELEAEKVEFRELIEYARQYRITDLRRAYAARAWEKRKSAPARQTPDPAVRRKKRAASGVTPRSSTATRGGERPAPKDTADAAERAWEQVMGAGA